MKNIIQENTISRKNWLIIEPRFYGHHYSYLENILNILLKRNINIVLATQNNVEGYQIIDRLFLRFDKNKIKYIFSDNQLSFSKKKSVYRLIISEIFTYIFYKNTFRKVIKEYKIDHVFIPYIDEFLFASSIFGSPFLKTSFSVISMRQRFHLFDMGIISKKQKFASIRKYIFKKFMKIPTLKNLYTIDETLKNYCDINLVEIKNKVIFTPDPISTQKNILTDSDCSISNLEFKGCVVLIYGYLDERKGIKEVLEIFNTVSSNIEVTLVFAGRQNRFANNLISNFKKFKNLTIKTYDRFISDDETFHLFKYSDYVWLGYKDFISMSNVLVIAARAKKKILFYDEGLIAYYAKKYGEEIHEGCEIMDYIPINLKIRSFNYENNNFCFDHSWIVFESNFIT